MEGILGLIPFLILFVTLGFTKVRAHLAAVVTMAVTGGMAMLLWHAPAAMVGTAAVEGTIVALVPIIWVIFAAVFTFLLSTETGAMEEIRQMLIKICPEPPLQAVLIAFCFGGFLEAVAGFGTAVAIPAAMLISIGFEAVPAAVICLVANSVPVAFGVLGIPAITLGTITHLDQTVLNPYIAVQLLPFAIGLPLGIALLARRGRKLEAQVISDVILIGLAFALVHTAVACWVGAELPAVAASLTSLLFYVILQHWRRSQAASVLSVRLLRAVLPFLILLVLVLVTRLIPLPFLKQSPWVLTVGFTGHPLKLDWLTTPGTIMLFSAVVGGLCQGTAWRRIGSLLGQTALKIKWTAVTIIAILIVAKVMGAAGMITSVAGMIAGLAGAGFPLISPLLGALGTFVTGSDTSSNILLGELQKQTALATGYDPHWIAAANTTGATAGKMISPQSLSIATTTLGIESRQRDIFRQTFLYCLAYVLVLGVFVWLVAVLGF